MNSEAEEIVRLKKWKNKIEYLIYVIIHKKFFLHFLLKCNSKVFYFKNNYCLADPKKGGKVDEDK